MFDESLAQKEAKTIGEEKETIKYLNKRPVVAIFIFVIVVVITQLWFMVMDSTLKKYLFRTQQFTPLQWFITASVCTVVVFMVTKYIFKIPITSAFSL